MDEITVRSLVERTQKPLFGFVLNLSSSGREKAFEMAVSSFTGALRSLAAAPSDADFLKALYRRAIEECRNISAPTGPDLSGLDALPPPKKEEMRLLKKAMFSLPFEQRCLLLLRDQQHFGYDDIAAVLGEPPREVRSEVFGARDALRDKMKQLLGGP